MAQLVIRGYKTTIKDFSKMEQLLKEVREKIMIRARTEYICLLSKEVATIFDDVALNKTNRPDSIFEAAKQVLNARVQNASIKQLPIEYNFNVSVHIFYAENGFILKVNCNNFIYEDVFKEFPEFEDYTVTAAEINENNKSDTKVFEWQKIMEEYSKHSPFGVTLLNGIDEFNDVDVNEITFIDTETRIDELARREVMTRFINRYADFKQIPPNKLMEYVDEAMVRMEQPESYAEYETIVKELSKIITPITVELIK